MSYPNRTMCSVLDEMRELYKTRNFAGLKGLIEEAQSIANRMESGLEDINDIKKSHDMKKKAEKETRKVTERLNELKILLPKDEQDEEEEEDFPSYLETLG